MSDNSENIPTKSDTEIAAPVEKAILDITEQRLRI